MAFMITVTALACKYKNEFDKVAAEKALIYDVDVPRYWRDAYDEIKLEEHIIKSIWYKFSTEAKKEVLVRPDKKLCFSIFNLFIDIKKMDYKKYHDNKKKLNEYLEQVNNPYGFFEDFEEDVRIDYE